MKHWTIAKRLTIGFASYTAIVVTLVIVYEVGLRDLRVQQDAGARRAADAVSIQALASAGGRAYRVVADTQVNLDFETSRREWATTKQEISTAIRQATDLVDTPEERRRLEELDAAFARIVSAYEEGMLPALAAAGSSTDATRALDARIDAEVDVIEAAATAIVASLAAESAEADELWDHTAASMTLRASVIAGAGISTLIVMSWLLIRTLNRRLRAVSGGLGAVSRDLVGASGQVSHAAQSLSQGATEQAASLEETSASMEEVGSMTRQNAENAQAAAHLVQDTESAVRGSNAALEDLIAAMAGIRDSSGQIARIIKTIDEIAFQTNILALNAAVEAARAGEAGMGFAVVADEVRSLAQRSAQAARDTAALIEDAMTRSAAGSAKVDQMAAAIGAITEKATRVRALVDDISTASREQAHGIDQVAQAIAQMERVTQTTAATAEESAAASEELNAQAEASRTLVGELEAMVGGQQATPVAGAGAARGRGARAAVHVLRMPGTTHARTGTEG